MKTPHSSLGHLPSLDGLRALSIFFVLFGHLNGTRHFGSWGTTYYLGDVAHLGVVVFFVISGFLITSLLLKEYTRLGRISLKLFYLRRALRIFPASYSFIACLALLSAMGILSLPTRDWIHAATYTVNYQADRSWFIGHLWSLSVEEQFYLLWPFAFAALGPLRGSWVAISVIFLGPVARLLAWWFLRGTPYRDLEMFPMVADSLAAGCLLAIRRDWLEHQAWYVGLFRPVPSLALLALVFMVNRLLGYTAGEVFGMAVINIAVAVLIHRCVYCSRDAAGRVLNWGPLAFCGTLSYSLYLWQQPFLNRDSHAWISAFPQNLSLAVGAALLSYLLLEKPLMQLRRRLEVVPTGLGRT